MKNPINMKNTNYTNAIEISQCHNLHVYEIGIIIVRMLQLAPIVPYTFLSNVDGDSREPTCDITNLYTKNY